LKSPAITSESIGRIDAVLLSHDHHFDNLDNAGRVFLSKVGDVLTTPAGAERLGGDVRPLEAWERIRLPNASHELSIVGTPARHGPPHADRGPVVGFVLENERTKKSVYLTGDTVWYEGVAEVGKRFNISIAVPFMGAACVPEVGPDHLTFTAKEGVEFARAFPEARIVPVHYEGWAHFVESQNEIDETFRTAGIAHRLIWLKPGVETMLEI
jgi:L-ascorbate metabolism protein UlaG (beta-lactamase superfamily)